VPCLKITFWKQCESKSGDPWQGRINKTAALQKGWR
jgi:hypothetical protein